MRTRRGRTAAVAAAVVATLGLAGTTTATADAVPVGEVESAAAVPIQVPLAVVRSISAGYAGGAVVTTTGQVWAWGNLRLDGFPGAPMRIPGAASTTSVSAGFVHAVALRSYGTAGARSTSGWGSPAFGSLGTTITTRPGSATPVAGLGAVADVVASADVTYARTLTGGVVAMGHDFYGQLGDGGGTANTSVPVPVVDTTGAPLQRITSLSEGANTLGCQLAIDEDGRVWEWGLNAFCEGSGGTSAAAVAPFGPSFRAVQAAANGQNQVVLAADGTVWRWGPGFSAPAQVPGLPEIVNIAQGSDHGLAIDGNDVVWAWGLNSYGQLGPAAPISPSPGGPVQVPGLSNIIDVAAGGQWSMALKGDGSVWTWGYNGGSQLGDGGTTTRATPAAVPIPEAAQPGGAILATGLFQPLSPDRLFDTRESTPVNAGGTLPVGVAGVRSVPADASAAWLNVTATNEAAPGYLTVWSCDEPRPLASSVNYEAGVDVPNAVAAPLGGTGSACIYSQERTDVVVDVNGAFTTEGYAFQPVAPARIFDTREQGGRLTAGGVLRVQVAGGHGVPADAAAAILNVTATDAAAAGYLTVYPCDRPRPEASNVNYRPGVDSPNAVAATLAADGSACIYSLQPVDVVVDVNGAFTGTGNIFNAITPARLADTRTSGRLAADGVLRVQVTGEAAVPEGATAAILNVTATGAAAAGYLTAYPCDQPRPLASNVNYRPNVDTPNAVVAPLAADGSTCLYTLRATDVVVDVNGFFQ